MAARKADHPLQRNDTRGRSALLPTVTYATYWDTIGKWPTRLLCDQPLSSTNRIASCKKLRK
ncbi:hypothetical protein B5K03_28970 [Rhizobium phaseoli]|nr:hypothetical protein B5K03_28970 [Rhizobium phaseoli]